MITSAPAAVADTAGATEQLRLFLKNRWMGLWPILYGDQVRQTALDNWIFKGTLDIEHLPEGAAVIPGEDKEQFAVPDTQPDATPPADETGCAETIEANTFQEGATR